MESKEASAVERIWHMEDSQGQILALACRLKFFEPFELFPLCSEADSQNTYGGGHSAHMSGTAPGAKLQPTSPWPYASVRGMVLLTSVSSEADGNDSPAAKGLKQGRSIRFGSPSEHGTYQTAKARIRPWLSDKGLEHLSRCSLFARKRCRD